MGLPRNSLITWLFLLPFLHDFCMDFRTDSRGFFIAHENWTSWLHMPGLARWFTPGRSSCESTLFIFIFFYHLLSILFFCFFFLLLLPLPLLPASSPSFSCSWGRLPFLAGEVSCLFLAGELNCLFWQEVGCLFGRIFQRGGDIACMCEGCSGGVFVVCHWPSQGWESTHRLHLYPLGGVFYSP